MNENGPYAFARSVNAWLFDASCDGGTNNFDIQVHADFNEAEAAKAAEKYGKAVGRRLFRPSANVLNELREEPRTGLHARPESSPIHRGHRRGHNVVPHQPTEGAEPLVWRDPLDPRGRQPVRETLPPVRRDSDI